MPPLDLPTFLPFRFERLAAEISRRLADMLAERFGIDLPQWRVLAALAGGARMTAQDIVAATGTHKSTVSRAVQELCDRGFLDRVPDPRDGRALVLDLTAEGRKLVATLVPAAMACENAILSTVTRDDGLKLLVGVSAMERAFGLQTV